MKSITYNQFKSSFEQHKKVVEQISPKHCATLWYDDWYDGMLSGMLEYENQKFRFEIITDYEKQIRPRVFAVISLTAQQIEEEIYWHGLFEKHVRDDTSDKPKSEHHLFYDEYQKRTNPNYGLNYVRAWYVEGQDAIE